MSLAQLWQLQQLELTLEQETKQLDGQVLKAILKEKELLLSRQNELKQEKNEWAELVKLHKRQGQELEQLESKKQELSNELYSGTVTNPKELSHLEEQVRKLDYQINTVMEEYINLEEKLTEMENNIQIKYDSLNQDLHIYNRKAKTAKATRQACQGRIEALTGEIKMLEQQIEPVLLEKYRRLQKRLGTAVLVPVQEGFCGGCGIKLPSIFGQQLKQGELVKCENCSRILLVTGQ